MKQQQGDSGPYVIWSWEHSTDSVQLTVRWLQSVEKGVVAAVDLLVDGFRQQQDEAATVDFGLN